jgi:hypothetical protein
VTDWHENGDSSYGGTFNILPDIGVGTPTDITRLSPSRDDEAGTINSYSKTGLTVVQGKEDILDLVDIFSHTLRDQQVPYCHEVLYLFKTLSSGPFLTRHFNVAIDRFEHCNFTVDEALGSFAILLFYDGVLQSISGTPSQLTSTEQAAFQNHMRAAGVPYRKTAAPLSFKLKD